MHIPELFIRNNKNSGKNSGKNGGDKDNNRKLKAKDRKKLEKEKSLEDKGYDAQKKVTPNNNVAQNKQFKDATKGLTKAQKRRVHDQITKKKLTYEEIKAIADELKK